MVSPAEVTLIVCSLGEGEKLSQYLVQGMVSGGSGHRGSTRGKSDTQWALYTALRDALHRPRGHGHQDVLEASLAASSSLPNTQPIIRRIPILSLLGSQA